MAYFNARFRHANKSRPNKKEKKLKAKKKVKQQRQRQTTHKNNGCVNWKRNEWHGNAMRKPQEAHKITNGLFLFERQRFFNKLLSLLLRFTCTLLPYLSIPFVISHNLCAALALWSAGVCIYAPLWTLITLQWRRRTVSGNRRNRSSCIIFATDCGF